MLTPVGDHAGCAIWAAAAFGADEAAPKGRILKQHRTGSPLDAAAEGAEIYICAPASAGGLDVRVGWRLWSAVGREFGVVHGLGLCGASFVSIHAGGGQGRSVEALTPGDGSAALPHMAGGGK